MKQHTAAVFLSIIFFACSAVAGLDQNRQVMIKSSIVVINTGAADATMALTPIDMSGNQLPAIVRTTSPNRSLSLDGSILGLQSGFSGSVIINADQPVIGVIQNDYTNTLGNRERSATTVRGADAPDKTVYLPLVRNKNHVESIIAVQNTGTVETDLIIDCYSASSAIKIISQSLLPGTMRLIEPPDNFDGSAVITSSEPIVVHSELINFKGGTASSCTGIPDNEKIVQSEQPFTYNNLDDLLTSLVMMNTSPGTDDGIIGYTDDPNSGWDWVDYPKIPPYHSINATPPAGTSWKIGLGLLSFFPKQVSIALTSNNVQSISYAAPSTPYPPWLLDTWHIPAVNDTTEINLFHDDAISTDFKITWNYDGIAQTENFSIGAYQRKTLPSPLPADSEGSVIIENLSAWPTGLAIEVKDKPGTGDHSVYLPAQVASTILFIPWLAYQYPVTSRSFSTSLLFQIISIIAAGNQKQPGRILKK